MNELIPGIIALVIMMLMFLNLLALIVLTVYSRSKIDVLLSRCSIVADHKKTFGGMGLMGDVVKLGVTGTLLVFTKAYASKTFVDPEQVKAFPKNLKFMIVGQGVALAANMLILVIYNLWIWLADVL